MNFWRSQPSAAEIPCACADRLTSSKSYRKKVVTNLTHEQDPAHLLQRSSSRLSARYPWQTSFAGTSARTISILSVRSHRHQLHQVIPRPAVCGCTVLLQAYVTMLNAGAAIYRDEKPPVFVPGGSSPCRIESTAFYDSREMKELGLEMIKVHGSRMVGSLMTPSHTFAVFNGMDAVPTFDTQIEQRGKIMLQNIRYTRTGASHTPDGILLSDQWTVMTTLLEDAKTYKKEHFLFGEGYEHFYFLTNDYHGETLLWLLCHPDVIGQLNATLLQELQPPCRNAFIENDARTDAGSPILFSYLPDLPRMFRFLSALELLQMKGAILCFDFQADALRSLCGDKVELQTIDFAEFERRFFSNP